MSREEAKRARHVAHAEMKGAIANEVRLRRASLSADLAAMKAGEHSIKDATDLRMVGAILITRAAEELDEFSRDEGQEPAFRAQCSRWKAEIGVRIFEGLAKAQPAAADDASAEKVIVVNSADLDRLGEIQRQAQLVAARKAG